MQGLGSDASYQPGAGAEGAGLAGYYQAAAPILSKVRS